ncbi:MAG TPA: lipocalin-like domain-containing protein [Bryobacteraceae bacterium]|nr:lipocalin-like domain-containing protein [Bryobacteraceae bacterium]
MDRRQAIGVLGLAGVASLKAAPSARDRFPGIYKLISWRTTNPDGSVVEPLGPDPIGRITYHKSGHMSVMLMRRDRKTLPRINVQTATIDQLREAFRQAQATGAGFIAYMGTYDVDESRNIVTHHIEGGSSPTFSGANFERHYELTSKSLFLSVPPALNSKLEWERVGDA